MITNLSKNSDCLQRDVCSLERVMHEVHRAAELRVPDFGCYYLIFLTQEGETALCIAQIGSNCSSDSGPDNFGGDFLTCLKDGPCAYNFYFLK